MHTMYEYHVWEAWTTDGIKEIEIHLNELGMQGWKLISVMEATSQNQYYFIRKSEVDKVLLTEGPPVKHQYVGKPQ